MEMIWNGRASAVRKDNPDIAFTYNDGILQNTQLCILKNAPNLQTAVRFVDVAVSPDLQANLPTYIDYGPGNPAAYKTGKISAARAAELPERTGKRGQAGPDVRRVVGVRRRHPGEGALAEVHAAISHRRRLVQREA
jgi:spermidine/putrescine-binding protein